MSQVRAGKCRVVNGRAFYYVDAASMNAVVTRGNFARRLIACAVYNFAHLVMTRRRGRIDSHQRDASAVQAFFGIARIAGLRSVRRCTRVEQYRGDDFELFGANHEIQPLARQSKCFLLALVTTHCRTELDQVGKRQIGKNFVFG